MVVTPAVGSGYEGERLKEGMIAKVDDVVCDEYKSDRHSFHRAEIIWLSSATFPLFV